VVELVACREVVSDAWSDAEADEERAAPDAVPVVDSLTVIVCPSEAVSGVGLRVTVRAAVRESDAGGEALAVGDIDVVGEALGTAVSVGKVTLGLESEIVRDDASLEETEFDSGGVAVDVGGE
jgi:hypothetical protein